MSWPKPQGRHRFDDFDGVPWMIRSARPDETAWERAFLGIPSRAPWAVVNTSSDAESSFGVALSASKSMVAIA